MRSEHEHQAKHQHLAALRTALDVRLAALEAALADPGRSESLAGLILDLARVATEEAQAAAAAACLDARRDADRHIAQARADGEKALDAERATHADLRRQVEETRRQIADFEAEQARLHASSTELEAARARARATAADLERDLADARRQLEAERESLADARRQLEAERDSNAAVQQTVADVRRAQAATQADLDAQRAAELELRQLADRAAEASAAANREKADIETAHDRLVAELAQQRATTADLYRLLADTQAQLEVEQKSAGDLRRTVERLEEQHAALVGSQSQTQAAHDTLQREASAARAEASFAQAELEEARTRIQGFESDAASSELRQAAQRAEEKLARLVDLQNETVAKTAAARRDLAAAQAEAASARSELEKMNARVHQLEADRASTSDLRAAVESAEQKLGSVTSVQVQTLANYEKLELELAIARQEASALQAKLAASEKRVVKLEKGGTHAKQLSASTEEEWASVRLSTRCVLREPIAIGVDDASGLLIDLSVDGCQILVPTAVKQSQAVKLLLPAEGASITCKGKVAWVRPEPPRDGQPAGYRVGVAFTKTDESALEALIVAHAAQKI